MAQAQISEGLIAPQINRPMAKAGFFGKPLVGGREGRIGGGVENFNFFRRQFHFAAGERRIFRARRTAANCPDNARHIFPVKSAGDFKDIPRRRGRRRFEGVLRGRAGQKKQRRRGRAGDASSRTRQVFARYGVR